MERIYESSMVMKNKNIFNLINKELRKALESRLRASYSRLTIRVKLKGESVSFIDRFGITLRLDPSKFEIVEHGSSVYLCVGLDTYLDKEDKVNIMSNIVNDIKYYSTRPNWFNKDDIETLKNYGMKFDDKGKEMRDLDVLSSKVYKDAQDAIDEIFSTNYKVKLIPNVYKSFKRRDLLPLMIYYDNTEEIRYIDNSRWSSNPENKAEYSRNYISNLDVQKIRNMSIRTVSNLPYSDWLVLDGIPDNLSKIAEVWIGT